MESLQGLKSRLRAVKNISQITKAMEVVSATKMRRAQEVALRSRTYAHKALEVIEKIQRNVPNTIPLLDKREIKKTLLLVVTSDRGLAGSFNSQIFRASDNLLQNDPYTAMPEHAFILASVGKKASQYVSRKKMDVAGIFHGFGDFAKLEEVEDLSEFLLGGFEKRVWDRVLTISTHFRTTLKQDVLVRQVLPVDFEKIHETAMEIVPLHGRYSELKDGNGHDDKETDYIIEPTPQEALEFLIPRLLKMEIYHLILEANASEHSARRVAMKNASDNADDLSSNLLLSYNKVRQASITKELIEITSTQNALQ